MNAMKPFGMALRDYTHGETSAEMILERDDGLKESLPASLFFRPPSEFSRLENAALDLCMGHVLDIGAGAGIHALALQDRGISVTAIDISPEAVRVMSERGVKEVRCTDIFDFRTDSFDTLLLLGHCIGMAGDLKGTDRFLEKAKTLLNPGGMLLLHSLDVTCTSDPRHKAYHAMNLEASRYIGEIRLRIRYKKFLGASYSWIQLDPDTLRTRAWNEGWLTEIIRQEEDGNYLAKLTLRKTNKDGCI
jgi:2-polyprenyl-3-methyl-5-hydroxy-6-metoxy-1,4-benzoquinol methylase